MRDIHRVTFIGIGNMGAPMAGHLVKAGFDVTVFDARPETVERFTARTGAKSAASIAEAARGADALVTMLPNDRIVREVVLGEAGAAAVLDRGAVVIDMSTSDPTATQALAESLAPKGIAVVDAPVMGGVVFAQDATLDIMAGGAVADVARCRPLFEAMGRSVMECGRVGSGHALKALANYVNACALVNGIEALTIGKKLGLDPGFMVEALVRMCAGRNHPFEKKIAPHVLTKKHGTGMTLGFIAKDLKIARDMAHAARAFSPIADTISDLWAAAADALGPDVDQTEIVRYWEAAGDVRLT
jgi:3-hydroxyisobutyrate dehydrogenase